MSTYAFAGRNSFHSRQIELYIGEVRPLGKPAYAELSLVEYTDGDWVPATTRLTPEAAQELMDSLWQCGLRPSEGAGSAGALAATQRHLDDMRALVFKTGKQ